MPFFSFVLNNNVPTNELNLLKDNSILLESNKKYFSKNTKVWKLLNSNNFKSRLKFLRQEKHTHIGKKTNKILFCLPPSVGLGDVIEYGLGVKAIEMQNLFLKVGLAFCEPAICILKNEFNLKNIYGDFISEDEMKEYDGVFHFTSQIQKLDSNKTQRQNIEELIIKYFKVSPYRNKISIKNKRIKRISIFPISKSPIRTLPSYILNDIIKYLDGQKLYIDLILDHSSIISNEIEKKLELNNIKLYSPKNLYELNKYIKDIEFGIFCDSGPLHLAKLYNKKGLLISTSVNAEKLIKNLDQIISYNVRYSSNFCEAPCGLTNIINFNGKHGCYDSLQKTNKIVMRDANKNILHRGDLPKSYKYFINNPVGCIKSIDIYMIKELIKKSLNH